VGAIAPPGDSARNPFAGQSKSAEEGKQLWSSMNCDGCHGGGEGWVGPSLSDGRWRYGGSDTAIFQSIFSGRPRGMPAFGRMLAPPIIWKLVTYIRSLPLPKSVPTQAW
jgi:cytochrome c oxidase cbb3-type subunit 3